MEPSSIISGLPPNHLSRTFSNLDTLRNDAREVLAELVRNNYHGSQYILVLDLPSPIRDLLDGDNKNILDGIPFRFSFEQNAGLIKIIPSYANATPVNRLSHQITLASIAASYPGDDIQWALNTTFRVGDQGKSPDNCFLPPSLQGRGCGPPGWPTLVIESGVSESLPKLREDVKRWFENSGGAVGIVIVLAINQADRIILLEKWQMGSETLSDMQPALNQHPFIAQTISITPTSTVGGIPLSLNFHCLFDRQPGPTQSDVVLGAQNLIKIAANL